MSDDFEKDFPYGFASRPAAGVVAPVEASPALSKGETCLFVLEDGTGHAYATTAAEEAKKRSEPDAVTAVTPGVRRRLGARYRRFAGFAFWMWVGVSLERPEPSTHLPHWVVLSLSFVGAFVAFMNAALALEHRDGA